MENKSNKETIDFYRSCATPEYFKAQEWIQNAPSKIEDSFSYDLTRESIKKASDVINEISEMRRRVTRPLDELKSRMIDYEKSMVNDFKQYIDRGKKMMLEYSNEIERKQKEANERIRSEAEEALKNAPIEDMVDLLGKFTDQMVSVSFEQPKGIRKTIKAEMTNAIDVDWIGVLNVLFSADLLEPEALLKNLPKAMKQCGVVKIKGINLVEVKSQTIR